MSASLSHRPAILVTGGAKRIGAEICRKFGQAGWHVIIHYGASHDEALQLAEELPFAETVQCDLSDGDAAVAMAQTLASRHADWRVLVNNASVFGYDNPRSMNPAVFAEAMAINAETPARLTLAFLKHAKAKHGRRAIQILDQKLRNTNPDFFSYTMSKHALAAIVPMLAIDGRGSKDRVYGLCPGAILPSHDQTEEEASRSHRLNLLARPTGTEEIADAAMFLAQGALASGEMIFIDSGQHLLAQPRDIIYLERESLSA